MFGEEREPAQEIETERKKADQFLIGASNASQVENKNAHAPLELTIMELWLYLFEN